MVYGSIYGASRIGVTEGSFDPKYAGPDGADLMVKEALDIDQKMFEIVVEHDFLECAAMENVELESALIAAKKRKINRHLGDSVFECIMMGSTKDVQEHVQYAAMESVDTMSIMDAAFMETVLKYTVLETVQTMGLYNFDHSDIKKICNHYMK